MCCFIIRTKIKKSMQASKYGDWTIEITPDSYSSSSTKDREMSSVKKLMDPNKCVTQRVVL